MKRKANKHTWKYQRNITTKDLINDLSQIEIDHGGVICIHSSLSRIGRVEGGAKTVISAIEEAFNKNITVMFPTYTLPGGSMEETLQSGYQFDVAQSRTTLGAIPACAQDHISIRSVHPTHSFVAFGPKANDLLKDHHRAVTPTGKGSPLYKMSYMSNAYLLLLGSPFGAFTSGHCAQDRVERFPYQPYSEKIYKVKCMTSDRKVVEVKTFVHNILASKYRWDHDEKTRSLLFGKIHEENVLRFFKIGKAKAILINCQELERVLEKLLDEGITIFGSLERLNRDRDTRKFILKDQERFWRK